LDDSPSLAARLAAVWRYLRMRKKYNAGGGVMFAFFVAVLLYIPRLIRDGLGTSLIGSLFLFLSIMFCWFIHHFFLLYVFPNASKPAPQVKALVSILVGMGFVFMLYWVYGSQTGVWLYWGAPDVQSTDKTLIINFFRSFTASAFTYFVARFLFVNAQLQNSRLENEYLKQDQLKAQLFSLQQQLSPHFLFNSLSTLKNIAPDEKTKTYVMQLANVYRYLLTFHDHQRISVQAELAFTRSYLYILQERLEDALHVSIAINKTYMDYYMPPLTLQILVENAVKHNVASREQPLYLRIYANADDTLTVENSYQAKRSTEESNGTGLQNIRDRYKLLAGTGIEVGCRHANFVVTLPLLK
jgi:two-component system LytT family sensor kinase